MSDPLKPSAGTVEAILVRHKVIDSAAIEDPEGYDCGQTKQRVTDATNEMGSAVGCDFYNGIEWLACWLLDNAEGETITEEQLRPLASKAWESHLKRQQAKSGSAVSTSALLGERRFLAYTLRKEGLKFKEVGKRMNVGAQRARQLYESAERRLNQKPHWTDGLGLRTANCLQNMSIESREQALEAYNSGRLHPGSPRHYGWKSHKEVSKWLGLPEPVQPDCSALRRWRPEPPNKSGHWWVRKKNKRTTATMVDVRRSGRQWQWSFPHGLTWNECDASIYPNYEWAGPILPPL